MRIQSKSREKYEKKTPNKNFKIIDSREILNSSGRKTSDRKNTSLLKLPFLNNSTNDQPINISDDSINIS